MLFDLIPPAWGSLLHGVEAELLAIESLLEKEEATGKAILPSRESIFAALELPPDEVRVVIVGQDPYPDSRFATGRAFAIPEGVSPLPGSLRNIMQEKKSDVGGANPAPSLLSWQHQGVLLLNRSLTTNAGQTNAHRSFGWQSVTHRILEVAAAKKSIALLWGKSAHSIAPLFGERAIISAHPSPLSAHRGFFGSKPFSRANQMLSQEIDW